MELTHDNIMKWMKEYFEVYSTYGQSPETAQRMNNYFTPDLRFIPYIAALGGPQGGFHSRDEFLSKAVSHPSWYEKLTPEEIIIDEKRKVAVVLFGMNVINRKTGETVIKKEAMSLYELVLDENNTIKIKTIRFFWEVMPPGVPEFYDLFKGE
ncbi:MAG: hypothetical protein JXA46_10110 [Dehalococcoidales bacterium]|nr:hypothetical protein [Dehalococcoidales bacterium]